MKCPNCGFNSFDYLEECKKCKLPLNPSHEYKSLYKKVPGEAVTDSVSPEESRVEKTPGYGDIGRGPEYKAVSDNIQDNAQSTFTDTDLEKDLPDYYSRGQRRALHSDAGGGGPEHEVRSGGIKSRGQRRALHSTQAEGAEIQAPELGPEPRFHDDLEPHTSDPILYSESNVPQGATNLEGATDSKEDSESYNIAGLKLRAAAFAIDLVIVSFIAYLAIGAGFLLLGDTDIPPKLLGRVYLPIYALLFFLASTYFVFLHYYAGRTLGKMAVGIRIISSEGNELGLWESFMRWVGYYISAVFLFAGFIWSVFDQDSQTWHDKIAGTYVVIG